MNIGTLAVTCDHIERVSPTGINNDNRLTILLDDVNADLLMRQMIANLDPEDVLSYFPDDVIAEYADKIKAVTLSPREQYKSFDGMNDYVSLDLSPREEEIVIKQKLMCNKWDAKLDESKCYDSI